MPARLLQVLIYEADLLSLHTDILKFWQAACGYDSRFQFDKAVLGEFLLNALIYFFDCLALSFNLFNYHQQMITSERDVHYRKYQRA